MSFFRNKKEPNELLKEATAKKKAGNLEGAIDVLKMAYKAIEKQGGGYTVEVFLRLPMYLQAAGRSDEAWNELARLLKSGYSGQLKSADVLPMEHALIYDKIRLFLQREGKHDQAVGFGICAYLAWPIGLCRQNRTSELKQWRKRNAADDTILELLKKAEKEHLLPQLRDLVNSRIGQLPNIDLEAVKEEVDSIVENAR